ncbi:Asp/Glu racemase [Lichenicola cladoniae]|uniref:Asp/Glu racemase n=1 Tax=Lichenicola cladoniae TaxID=1484109 RepID=A0A6M8HW57_9PROT|nr:aspartate/glutamate racemase family protein [Lichenicola cladoniae]NPD66041.1 Asp/Glu racemase [Acetobacteraceae bacterium]QKE92405.1 Asp/Glu racemase [Lichenicola cladoniae]
MPGGRILIVNPNSSARVTAVIDRALEPLRRTTSMRIEVVGNPSGPPGIALQADADSVAPFVQDTVGQSDALACVIACFSDPGLHGAREASAGRIVLGCGESGILHAMMSGDRFGIISLSESSTQRQRRMVRTMGVASRYAGSVSLSATAEDVTSPAMFEAMAGAGDELVRQGANVVVMGCAGMAHCRDALERRLGVIVIDPVDSAVAMAIGLCCLKGSRVHGDAA